MNKVTFAAFGEPQDVLSVVESSNPEPKSGEVRVRMLAAPINPSDLMTIRGTYGKRSNLPFTPGYEGVGVVEASGGGMLAKMLVGKRVAVGCRDGGGWSEQVVLPFKQVVPLDSRIPDEQAAMFFVNPITAFVLTHRALRIPAGEWLLQTAANSAVGRMVIRLGQRTGFKTCNIVRREDQVKSLKAIGADEVIVFDPRKDSAGLSDRVRAACGSDGVRFAIDPVGGPMGSAVIGCLGLGARMMVFGTLSDEPLAFSSRALMTIRAGVEGFWLPRYMEQFGLLAKLKLIRAVGKLVVDGTLAADVGEKFNLKDIVAAVEAAESSGREGKVLLTFGEQP
ncbi:MAG: zinc-dependent alcohol dehydrogenase family protein [Planctomycetota bacterium]|nr:zinc-dependent alcohol dehydrogenase family protein [Planctomycetota bacterium]